MDVLNIFIRVVAIVFTVVVALLFSKAPLLTFFGIEWAKKFFFWLNMFLFAGQMIVAYAEGTMFKSGVEFNLALILLGMFTQKLGIWQQRKNIATLLLENSPHNVRFVVSQIVGDVAVGYVHAGDFAIEAYADEAKQFEEGEVYENVDLHLEFDQHGHPVSLLVMLDDEAASQ